MSVQAVDYFQEASLLRPGSAIRLTGVTWDDYVNLTTGDRDLPGKRVYYDSKPERSPSCIPRLATRESLDRRAT
jgi:hypothetical protein